MVDVKVEMMAVWRADRKVEMRDKKTVETRVAGKVGE